MFTIPPYIASFTSEPDPDNPLKALSGFAAMEDLYLFMLCYLFYCFAATN